MGTGLPPTPWRIRRTTFSAAPWRLVDADGDWIPLGWETPHPDLQGAPPAMPITGAATKAECIDLVCDLLARVVEARRQEADR